ncbi:MAG: bifunctional (p)ppGpp synthetase/guanosine-3',5'-bis(diphosphate) 3'-pyrophosphohydrolase, partial [Clostridia bacterium]|nr:bifunctional (p)ppGpp synthetase/guanosine-3',5'-bis(diphosphate) 3'-pyrophosphohydrolase [Clostridia bacterium]
MYDANLSFEQLKENIAKYNPDSNLELIKKAGDFATKAHEGQNRKSGEPFVIHPYNVAIILSELEMDDEAIIAGLLHDTVEDTSCTIQDIKDMFGENVALLVEGVTKLGKIPYSTKQEQQVENLRKMFLAMAKDIRVIIIKLADRLHNMRTLKSMSEEKQREKAHETMEVFAPLANRLGMQKVKWELEDLSLRYLDPIAYKEISDHISLKRGERIEYLENVKSTLQERLDEMGIEAGMSGRAKHFYSIYKKMYTNNISIDEIYDLLAVRVIVNSINECYAVLGMVHEIYKPIPGRFKDYIAMPKKNMYQSLHTSLIGPGGRPFEVQIRTWEMHKIAEVGIAAHWKYKEGVSGATDLDNKLEWVRQLLEIHRDMNDAEDFINNLKIDLFEDEVFVFSPKGAVINLPNGAGPIDFAYAIHTQVGEKAVGAKVNGRMVPLTAKLKTGDVVEIVTNPNSFGPSRDWIKIVKTNKARNRIRQFLKNQDKELSVNK